MKTKLIILLPALMLWGVAACGGTDDDTNTETSNNDSQEEEDDRGSDAGFCTYTFTNSHKAKITIDLTAEQDERSDFLDEADTFLDEFADDYDSDADYPAAINVHVDNTDGETTFVSEPAGSLNIYDDSGDRHRLLIAPDWNTFQDFTGFDNEEMMPQPEDSELEDLQEYNDGQKDLIDYEVNLDSGSEDDFLAVIDDHIDSVDRVEFMDDTLECD